MKILRQPAPAAPKSRSIMKFNQPSPTPAPAKSKVPRGATPTAREAIRKAMNPPGIDPRQMRY